MSTRVYYRMTWELLSPLSIGAADSDQTDNDVLLDSKGDPIIPAGSVAGVLRSFFYDPYARYDKDKNIDEREDVCNRIFGTLDDPNNMDSAVRTYDATLASDSPNKTVSVRDGVKLKEDDKVPEAKKKFDRQIVESGATFQACLEILDEARCSTDDLEASLKALGSGALRFGSKSTRGYGKVKIVSCTRKRFSLPGESDEWIDFDPMDMDDVAWERGDTKPITFNDELYCGPHDAVLKLSLRLVGGISVREYQTEADGAHYSQLSVHGIKDKNGEFIPVIPGTSWAGALLARCRNKYVVKSYGDYASCLFGEVDEKSKTKVRSRLTIDESRVLGSKRKQYTRNAIDRLTGGTVDTALYTEDFCWGGTTELIISIRNVDRLGASPAGILQPLVASLADLHNGFLAVGGLTAVGRGMFTIDTAESKVLVGGQDAEVTEEFFKAFMGNADGRAKDGFARPDVTAAAQLLCNGCNGKGGAA